MSFYPPPLPREDTAENSSDLESSSDERALSPPPSSSSFVPHQRITLDTELASDNRGFKMLQRMGWKGSGQGLGISGNGRTQPIPMVVSTPGLGIGKLSQDTRVLDEVVGKGRREMESERWAGLSESERGKGVEAVAKRLEVKKEIAVTLRPFYCLPCDKQYATVAQHDSHLNSYDHQHVVVRNLSFHSLLTAQTPQPKACAQPARRVELISSAPSSQRLKSLAASHRASTSGSQTVEERKEKERKREEKEMEREMRARGVAVTGGKKASGGPKRGKSAAGGAKFSFSVPTKESWAGGTGQEGKKGVKAELSATTTRLSLPPPEPASFAPPSPPPPPPVQQSPPPPPPLPPQAQPTPLPPPANHPRSPSGPASPFFPASRSISNHPLPLQRNDSLLPPTHSPLAISPLGRSASPFEEATKRKALPPPPTFVKSTRSLPPPFPALLHAGPALDVGRERKAKRSRWDSDASTPSFVPPPPSDLPPAPPPQPPPSSIPLSFRPVPIAITPSSSSNGAKSFVSVLPKSTWTPPPPPPDDFPPPPPPPPPEGAPPPPPPPSPPPLSSAWHPPPPPPSKRPT